MTGRMESVETPAQSKPSSNAQRRGFPTLPTAPWKSLRDSYIPTAPATTIFSYQQGGISTGLPRGHFYWALTLHRRRVDILVAH